MRDLTLSELRVVSGGQAEEEPPRILDTITVRGTRPPTRPFPSFSYPTGPIGMETGEVLNVGEQQEGEIPRSHELNLDPSPEDGVEGLQITYVEDEYGNWTGEYLVIAEVSGFIDFNTKTGESNGVFDKGSEATLYQGQSFTVPADLLHLDEHFIPFDDLGS